MENINVKHPNKIIRLDPYNVSFWKSLFNSTEEILKTQIRNELKFFKNKFRKLPLKVKLYVGIDIYEEFEYYISYHPLRNFRSYRREPTYKILNIYNLEIPIICDWSVDSSIAILEVQF